MTQLISDDMTAAIADVIHYHEDRLNHELPKEEFDFLVASYSKLIIDMALYPRNEISVMLHAEFNSEVLSHVYPKLVHKLAAKLPYSRQHEQDRVAIMIHNLADKYVTGSKEHSDSPFFSIDFDREIRNELLDLFHYRHGRIYSRTNRRK